MSAMIALALAALLAAPARAAQAPLLEVVSRRTIAPASFVPAAAPQPQIVPLALVVEDGSGWDAPGVLERALGKASAIFGQCRVALGTVEVTTARWSPEALRILNNPDPYKGPEETGVMSDPHIPALRPVGLLFGAKSIPSTAKAFNKSSVAVFSRQFPDATLLLDTFWMTLDQETRPRRADEAASFSVPAHELTHVLGDLPHTPVSPNLMTEGEQPGAKSGDLTPEQCAA
ncbi:MAG: hypothetical protein KGL74_02205, partial [Elusimicrobia bacterium]|nr:hypothetical protein [Elusimicrobiota bacterium]